MKEIQIRRREAKSHLPPAIVANAKKTLSSIFDGQAPLKGVSGDEEEQLLSELLGIDSAERDFGKACRMWWANLRVDIPSDGKVLNISKGKGGRPQNINHYLIYKWALKHKYVADSRAALLANSKKQFYIYDPEVETKENNKMVQVKKKAYEEFIRMSDNEDKINLVLTVLSDTNPDNMSAEQKENYIDQLIDEEPRKFVAVATDKHLELKAHIFNLVEANVLTKIDSQYWFSDELLGNNLDETVKYFENPKNSKTTEILKGKLEAARKTE
jgi:hypothetical protein